MKKKLCLINCENSEITIGDNGSILPTWSVGNVAIVDVIAVTSTINQLIKIFSILTRHFQVSRISFVVWNGKFRERSFNQQMRAIDLTVTRKSYKSRASFQF